MTVSLQPAQLRAFHSPAKSCLVGLTVLTPSCLRSLKTQELCECRGGRPGLPVPNKPDGFCGRKATLKLNLSPKRFWRGPISVEVG